MRKSSSCRERITATFCPRNCGAKSSARCRKRFLRFTDAPNKEETARRASAESGKESAACRPRLAERCAQRGKSFAEDGLPRPSRHLCRCGDRRKANERTDGL